MSVKHLETTVLLTMVLLFCGGCSGERPGNLGLADGRLRPCPDTPNCISTQAAPDDEQHFAAPLELHVPARAAYTRLVGIVAAMERTRIVRQEQNYIYAECTSRLFRFVDDLEIFIDESAGLIHIRSASRLGKSDLGVNRRRYETIKKAYLAE